MTRARSKTRNSSTMRKLVVGALLVGLFGFVGVQWLRGKVNRETRGKIEYELNQHLNPIGLSVEVTNARFIEGSGFLLSDVRLYSQEQSPSDVPLLQVYEAFFAMNADLTDLIASNIDNTKLPATGIEIRRAQLDLARNQNGQWNIDPVLQRITKYQSDSNSLSRIPIRLTDSTIRIVDDTIQPQREQVFRDIDIALDHIHYEGRPLIQVVSGFSGNHVSDVGVTTYVDLANKNWRSTLHAGRARLTPELLEALPPQLQEATGKTTQISGTVSLNGWAEGTIPLSEFPRFQVTGNVQQFDLANENLPLPISRVSAEFELSDQHVSIKNAEGRVGQGTFLVNYSQSGLFARNAWQANGNFQQFMVDQNINRWFPNCKKFCEDFAPQGTANIEFQLNHDGTRLKRTILSDLTDMSFRYVRFPFQVNHCTGTIRWIDDVCKFKVNTTEAQQPMVMKGTIKNVGPDATYTIDMGVGGFIPINEKLLTAGDAKPSLSKVVRAFNAHGGVKMVARFEKNIPRGTVNKAYDIDFNQCSIRHDQFQYPLYNVKGSVRVRNDELQFNEITGENNSAHATCNGTWDPTSGLELRFICNSVPLEDQLKHALRPEIQQIWSDLRPQGTLGLVRADLTLPPGKSDCRLNVNANLTPRGPLEQEGTVSIQPTWFPYLLTGLTGEVSIGEGQVALKDMKGKHNRTWVTGQGTGQYSSQDWAVTLSDLLIGSLKIDEDLVRAMPRPLQTTLRTLKYKGIVNVNGKITLMGEHEQRAPVNNFAHLPVGSSHIAQASHVAPVNHTSLKPEQISPSSVTSNLPQQTAQDGRGTAGQSRMAWDLGFDMNNAEMEVGLPIKNVYGAVQLTGNYDGIDLKCRGDLAVDSLTLYDAQITDVKGPLWFDNQRAGVGSLSMRQSDSNKEPPSITGTLSGGLVQLDAMVSNATPAEFFVQASLADGDLKEMAADLAPQTTHVEGRSYAGIRLKGNTATINSLQGIGSIQIRDAKIYELPVVLSLLKILRIRQINRTAFDSGDLDFTMNGPNLNFHRMEFIGDAISLLGNGEMNLDREIDLNFYSVLGRNRFEIPILSKLHRLSSQKILWISVDGSLDDPKTHRKMLPQLNESLRQLFGQPLPNEVPQPRVGSNWKYPGQ